VYFPLYISYMRKVKIGVCFGSEVFQTKVLKRKKNHVILELEMIPSHICACDFEYLISAQKITDATEFSNCVRALSFIVVSSKFMLHPKLDIILQQKFEISLPKRM
jgi:hypothetical protein